MLVGAGCAGDGGADLGWLGCAEGRRGWRCPDMCEDAMTVEVNGRDIEDVETACRIGGPVLCQDILMTGASLLKFHTLVAVVASR